jgi:hypothetical protein
MKRTVIIILAATIAATPMFTAAHTAILQPDGAASKDAGIFETNPNTEYGDYEFFWTGYDEGYADSLIKFNELDAYAGATVTYAELNLYCFDEWGTLTGDNRVFRADAAWDESTVTWNNAPGYESTMWEGFDAPAVDDWLTVDVTTLVESWLDGSYPHHGFYIASDQATNGGRYFYSGESTEETLRPYIYMEYSCDAIAPASLGEIKATFR